MKLTTKVAMLLVALLILLLAGSWLSGKLLFLWFGFDNRAPGLLTWWEYFRLVQDPRYMPHAGKIKGSGLLGFGLPVGLWLGLLLLMLMLSLRMAMPALPTMLR